MRRRQASASPSHAIQPEFTPDELLPICTIIHFFDAHASSSEPAFCPSSTCSTEKYLEPVLYLLPQSSVLQGEAPCFVKSLSERICASSPTWQVFAHAPPALPQTSSGWGRDHINAAQICTEQAIGGGGGGGGGIAIRVLYGHPQRFFRGLLKQLPQFEWDCLLQIAEVCESLGAERLLDVLKREIYLRSYFSIPDPHISRQLHSVLRRMSLAALVSLACARLGGPFPKLLLKELRNLREIAQHSEEFN